MSFVALATCKCLPEPDFDEPLLLGALDAVGVAPRMLAWDDELAPWSQARVVVIRSTWNYYERPADFLAWARTIGPRLHNPLPVVEWNHHKSYLRELGRHGLPTVPTLWIDRIDRGDALSEASLAPGRAWSDVVIKPAVSAGSYRTSRLQGEWWKSDAIAALARLGDTMIQPYVRSVDTYGERSLVFVDGELTHAIRKAPRFTGDAESVSDAVAMAPDERELARRAIDAAPAPPLYGRIDVVRDERAQPMLSEVELLEPSLFLRQSPAACERLARAIARVFHGRG